MWNIFRARGLYLTLDFLSYLLQSPAADVMEIMKRKRAVHEHVIAATQQKEATLKATKQAFPVSWCLSWYLISAAAEFWQNCGLLSAVFSPDLSMAFQSQDEVEVEQPSSDAPAKKRRKKAGGTCLWLGAIFFCILSVSVTSCPWVSVWNLKSFSSVCWDFWC